MSYKIPLGKRLFDIVITTFILIIASPLFILVAIAIRLDYKGKVFYYQPRVGMNYKIFPFFKFRSMYVNADKQVTALKDQSQYKTASQSAKKGNCYRDYNDIVVSDDGILNHKDFEKQS